MFRIGGGGQNDGVGRERERLVSQLDRTMDLRKMGSLCAANHSGGEAGFWGLVLGPSS